VIQVEAIFMLLFGMIGKFGALFVTIPEPVIGGVFLVMFGEYILLLLLLLLLIIIIMLMRFVDEVAGHSS